MKNPWIGLACLAGLWLAGCGSKSVSELMDKAKESAQQATQSVSDQAKKASDQVQQQVSQVATKVKEEAALAGNAQFQLDAPVAAKACYATLIPGSAGRPSVMHLQSYKSAAEESFPSFFVHAEVKGEAFSELVGQTVPAQLFVQSQQNGPVLHTTGAAPIQLKLSGIEGRMLAAEIASGEVRDAASGKNFPVSGKLSAVMPK